MLVVLLLYYGGQLADRRLVNSNGVNKTMRLLFNAKDVSIGMSEDERTKLFQPFHGSFAGGTGLGLSIVKHLAAAMGGEVGMNPVSPKGSKFWIRLPSE